MYCHMFYCALLTSCVTFPGGAIPDKQTQKFGPIQRKMSVNFTNNAIVRDGNTTQADENTKPIVEGYMLTDSELFITTQSIAGSEDYQLRFKTITEPADHQFWRKIPVGLYFAVSLATLTLIPFFHKDHRSLEVEVVQGDNVLKKYSYADYISYATWLFFLPYWGISGDSEYWYRSEENHKNVDQNLVKTFLLDFREDFIPRP